MTSIGQSFAHTNAKSYLWSFPGCPVQIYIGLELVERLRTEVVALAAPDREVGGLLLGSADPYRPEVRVSDYFLVAPSAGSNQYLICANNLTQALASCAATQRQVVGYFRTHLGLRIQLRAEELECIQQKFRDPNNVFLVIRPHADRASAGFFFWQEGSVFGDSTLTFPLSAAELGKAEWSTLVGGSHPEGRVSSALARLKARVSEGASRTGLALFAVTILFVILLFSARYLYVNDQKAPPPVSDPPLGLQARRDGLALVVKWNASSPRLAAVREANLLIWDGPGQPVYLPLTLEQLRSGGTMVTALNDKVSIRMDVVGETGQSKIESISVSRENTPASPGAPPVDGGTEQAKTDAVAPSDAPKQQIADAPKVPAAEPNAVAAPQSSDTPAPRSWKIIREASEVGKTQPAEPIKETQAIVPSAIKTQIDSDTVVAVLVKINSAGKVIWAKAASEKGPAAKSLTRYAEKAALGWRFRPALDHGKPVESEKTIEFLFRPETAR